MPEKGWYSISVRENTAKVIRENAKTNKMTVDAYLNHLMAAPQDPQSKTDWITCEICGAKVKPENLKGHISRNHPKHLFKK